MLRAVTPNTRVMFVANPNNPTGTMAPRGDIVTAVQNAARSVSGVVEVEKCYLRKMGLSYYADLHVGVNGSISVREGHHIAHQVKRAIQSADPRIADVLVHIEPARE